MIDTIIDIIIILLGSAALTALLLGMIGFGINRIIHYREEYFAVALFWVWLSVRRRRTKHTRRDIDLLYERAKYELEQRDGIDPEAQL